MRGVFAEVRELDDDETLTFLHSTISTHHHPVRRPSVPMYLDGVLPDMAFTPGDVPMLGTSYIPTCTIAGFPPSSYPGILDDLNHLAIEYRWVTRFICLDKRDAELELERYRKWWWQSRKGLATLLKEEATKEESAFVDGSAASRAGDADAALNELGEDLVSFGFFTATITVCDRDLDDARRKMQAIKQVVQGRGFVCRDETLNSRDAWLGSIPGNVGPNNNPQAAPQLRQPGAPHAGVGGLGRGRGELPPEEHLRRLRDAHVYCSSDGRHALFGWNLSIGDVGHTLIVGPTGAGKSTLLSLLAMQWLRYPNAQVVIFDKDRSARAATLAVRGAYYDPGNERAPVAFQPLAAIDDRAERLWATRFVLNLFIAQRVAETPELKARVAKELAGLAQAPRPQRTLSVLAGLLGPQLGAVLLPYTFVDRDPGGRFGQVFDAKRDDLTDNAWQLFEMGSLMALGEEAVVPALDFLFHRVERRFDGRPTLLILDEAWLFLKHPIFMARLQDWLKTLRKRNVYVVFATQEIADAAASPILPTILSACPTKIYLPNEEALAPHLTRSYSDFGLTDAEITIVAHAQKKRDYYYRSVRGRRLFSLDLGEVALAFVAMSSPDDQRVLDELAAAAPPERHAELILRHRRLDWAADLLAQTAAVVGPFRT